MNTEKIDSGSEAQESSFDALTKLDAESNSQAESAPQEYRERLLYRASLYRSFGKVALSLSELEKAKETTLEDVEVAYGDHEKEHSPEGDQADALIHQLRSALDDVDRSLENQVDYDIINHKQINTKDALERELQSGTSIPELDIRFDMDGKPWISHSPRAGTRFFFSKPIHKLHSDEVAEYGQRLSLEDGLDIFKEYQDDNANHKVVLEIKELGPSRDTHPELLGNIRELLEARGLTDSVVFATLSPDILKSVHDAFPENSKILNGGIAPIISYDLAEKSMQDAPDKEFAVKIPNVELFFSNSSEIADHADGYGKQTGYLWTRLPKETVSTLRQLNADGKIGAASLTVVNKFANILEKFSPKTAKALRTHYAAQLDKLGIKKQVAISKSSPVKSLHDVKEQIGQDAIIYSDTSPGDWAAELEKKE